MITNQGIRGAMVVRLSLDQKVVLFHSRWVHSIFNVHLISSSKTCFSLVKLKILLHLLLDKLNLSCSP